jgi:hypothetical protein
MVNARMYLGKLGRGIYLVLGKATLPGHPIDEEQQLALTNLIDTALNK